MRGLLNNLRNGFRAAFFLRIRAGELCVSPGQFIALVVLSLALQIGAGILRGAGAGQFDISALPRSVVYVPLLLFAVWLIGLGGRDGSRFRLEVAILFCAISVPIDLAFEALDQADWPAVSGLGDAYVWTTRLWYLLYAWWLAALAVGAARAIDGGRLRRAWSAAMLLLLVPVPLWYIPGAALWQTPDEALDAEQSSASQEEVLYAQPALLDEALDRLEPERPGVTDMYFVGVAGYAAQDVFMKELDAIGALFRERFDTTGRMIALVNNSKTVSEVPVATVTALSRILDELSTIMNVEEDVLFLYLTSHGSEDHHVAMQFAPLRLRDVEPGMLRRMLDEAGIKWRVIVISACYSGGFVDALKDDNTLIITASDADHQSFGCDSASDFTYFGRAYFDQALRQTTSFIDAFVRARAAILELEKAQALAPSNPQMNLGAGIEPKLHELSERLSHQRRDRDLTPRLPGRAVRLDADTVDRQALRPLPSFTDAVVERAGAVEAR